jgi:hypothetical protein
MAACGRPSAVTVVTFRQLSDREEEAILVTLKRRIDFREEPRGPCCTDPELLHMSRDELFQALAKPCEIGEHK